MNGSPERIHSGVPKPANMVLQEDASKTDEQPKPERPELLLEVPVPLTAEEKSICSHLENHGVFDYVTQGTASPHVIWLLKRMHFGRLFYKKMKNARQFLKKHKIQESAPEAKDTFTRKMAEYAKAIVEKVPKDQTGQAISKEASVFIAQSMEGGKETAEETNLRITGLGHSIFQAKRNAKYAGEYSKEPAEAPHGSTSIKKEWEQVHEELSTLHKKIKNTFDKRTKLANWMQPTVDALIDFHDEKEMVVRQKGAVESIKGKLLQTLDQKTISNIWYGNVLDLATPMIPDAVYDALAYKIDKKQEVPIKVFERTKLIKKCEEIIARYEEMVRAYEDAIAETEDAIRKR